MQRKESSPTTSKTKTGSLRSASLNEVEACKFFQQLVSAIGYLHKIGCAHRDIKPSNILIDYFGNIKLIDFGLGNIYDENEKLKTACGSPCYAAPEVCAFDPDHLGGVLRPHNGRHLEQRHHALRDALRLPALRRREQDRALQQDPLLPVQNPQVRLVCRSRPHLEDPRLQSLRAADPRADPCAPLDVAAPAAELRVGPLLLRGRHAHPRG